MSEATGCVGRVGLVLAAITLTACGRLGGRPGGVTFVMQNRASEALAFDLDRGWQPNLLAFRGRPPHARWFLMFPTHCTAACAAPRRERCPVCREPERPRDIVAAQKLERVAPGDDLEVEWDGRMVVYRRAPGAACACYRTAAPPTGTYTIKACGLRLTRSAERSSELQCVQSKVTFPIGGHPRVELEFDAPARPRAH